MNIKMNNIERMIEIKIKNGKFHPIKRANSPPLNKQ